MPSLSPRSRLAVPRDPLPPPDRVARDVAARAAAAGFRLRFDKVALRVCARLGALAGAIPDDAAVLVAIAAPIRKPAETVAVLEGNLRHGLSGEAAISVCGNAVGLRWLAGCPARAPRVLCLVYTSGPDIDVLLDLAEGYLRDDD